MSSRQLIVGLFLLGGIVLFAVGLFWIGNRRLLFQDHLVLHAGFHNLSGLKSGAKVRVAGLDGGEVLAIAVPPGPESKFRVTFRILEKFSPILRSDSVATIQTEGLVGNMILQVDAGSNQGSPVSSGDTIQSREPVEIADMLQQASETVETLNQAILDVKKRVDETFEQVSGLAAETGEVVVSVSNQLDRFVATGSRVADDVEAIVGRVRRNEGTIGKLVNDPQLYESLKATVGEVEKSAANIRETTEQAKLVLAQLRSSGTIENAAGTIANVRELTEQAKGVLAGLRSKGGEANGGLVSDLQATLANAREATAGLAANMEALKRNFLTRGFFRDRGFYNLSDLSVAEYRAGKFAPRRPRRRTWIRQNELFVTGPDGALRLSDSGKETLDRAIAPYLVHAPSTPLIVEGYSATGDESEQYLRSREQASAVRQYLLDKFGLNPGYVGVMPLGAVEPEAAGRGLREGVALVYFPDDDSKAGNDLRMPGALDGFRVLFGGLPTDSGFALGAAYQESRLLGGLIDAGVHGRVSHKRYLQGDLRADLPRLWNGNLFVETTTRYSRYPEQEFFGLGPDSSKAARTNFHIESTGYALDAGFRPWRGLQVGAGAGYMTVDTRPGKDEDFPSTEERFTPDEAPGLLGGSDYAHAGAFVKYAFDEDPPLPFFDAWNVSGDYGFRWTYYDDRNNLGSSFRRYDVDLRHYIPVRERGMVAARTLVSFTDAPPGQQAPFYMLPTVGGADTVRGFHQSRFRDNNALLLNLEYRHWLLSYLDLVAFVDAGKVFSRVGDLALGGLEASAGVGARFRLGEKVILGVDVGFSREGVRPWVRGGHTF